MSTAWADVALTAVAATGDLTQLFPTFAAVGSAATTSGALRRRACEGTLLGCEVEPDGANGGELELWDLNGADVGANVNTAVAITNAQLVALQALGLARLMYSQKFTATAGARLAFSHAIPFSKGLAARYVSATGTCELNLRVDGGYRYTEICGA
jgi:hypothetical protein